LEFILPTEVQVWKPKAIIDKDGRCMGEDMEEPPISKKERKCPLDYFYRVVEHILSFLNR